MGWTSDNATTGIVIPARIFMYVDDRRQSYCIQGRRRRGGGGSQGSDPHF